MSLSSPTPILRSFDEAKAKEFWVSFLGFSVDWEHPEAARVAAASASQRERRSRRQ
jgi:hypothetical protein